jgi:DNA-binding NtrC family response regulator
MWKWSRQIAQQPSDVGLRGARVLLVTADEHYRGRWEQVFAARGWDLRYAGNVAQAVTTLLTHHFPVVIYDCNASGEDWRDALSALCSAPGLPCVLLTSNVINGNIRDEVVRLHGYDVMSRRADDDEIARTINSAWFWKHRHV